MLWRALSLAALVALAATPLTTADPLPHPECESSGALHHYAIAGGVMVAGGGPAAHNAVDGSIGPCPGSAFGDEHPEFGVGAAWLFGDHHGDVVCVDDDAGPVAWYADGIDQIQPVGPFFTACAALAPDLVGHTVAVVAGVFVLPDGEVFVSAPLGGHIYTL